MGGREWAGGGSHPLVAMAPSGGGMAGGMTGAIMGMGAKYCAAVAPMMCQSEAVRGLREAVVCLLSVEGEVEALEGAERMALREAAGGEGRRA